MTPAETATASADAMWAGDRACRHLGIAIDSVAPGTAVLSMTVAGTMANGHGMCHGGYIFTLADSAFAYACNSHGDKVVAQAAQIAFLAPARVGDRLTATATEVHRAGRSGLYDIRVTRDDGAVIAEFRGQSRTIPGSHLGTE